MKSKPIIITIVLILILLILAYMWPFKKTSNQPKIVETRTFSCPGMEGFTFEYPVFEGWEPSNPRLDDKNRCVISLHYPQMLTFEITPTIYVTLVPDWSLNKQQEKGSQISEKINSNGVIYDRLQIQHQPMFYAFYTQNFGVSISVWPVDEERGFLSDLFFQTVIKSFKLIK